MNTTPRALLIAATVLAVVAGGIWLRSAPSQANAKRKTGSTTYDVTPVADGDQVWEGLRQRPLVLPKPAPGAPCPVTPTSAVLPGQILPGDGPIYVRFKTDGGPLRYGTSPADGGWHYIKILWLASGAYTGPALIRGHQLDGPNEVRFERGDNPPAELQFPVETGVRSEYTVNGWRDNGSYTRLRAPGCYAWQVDGLTFRSVIVFRAEP